MREIINNVWVGEKPPKSKKAGWLKEDGLYLWKDKQWRNTIEVVEKEPEIVEKVIMIKPDLDNYVTKDELKECLKL